MDDRVSKDLISSFDDVPIIEIGEYQYFVHPLSDGVREIDPVMLSSFASETSSRIRKLGKIDF